MKGVRRVKAVTDPNRSTIADTMLENEWFANVGIMKNHCIRDECVEAAKQEFLNSGEWPSYETGKCPSCGESVE